MKNREKTCRFCFEKCDTYFKAIDEGTQEILNMLLITMNLTISKEPVMCTNCSETIQNSFVFKKTYLDVRNRRVAFSNDKNGGHAVCEFCVNVLENCSFSMLDVEDKILEKYFPELDISANKKPSICEACHGSLVNFYSFITTSSIVEEKIKAYCEAEGVNNEDPIKLISVVQFASKNICKEEDKSETLWVESKIQEVCTLCLVKCENFKTINGKTKDILDILLPKLDFTVIQNPVVCKNCEEMLIKCFDFKAKCLYTQNYVVSFLNKSDVPLDLKDVYLSKNVTSPGVPEDQDICRFCMGLVNNCSAVSLDVEGGDVVVKEMVKECLSELDLSVINRPVICSSCHESLKDCFHFVNICLVIGEKIKKYCETLGTNSKSQIDLSGLLQLTLLDVTRKAEGNLTATIKVEQFCEDRENVDEREICNGDDTVKLEEIFFEDSKITIKGIENKSFMEVNNRKVNNEQQFTLKNKLVCTEESNKIGSIKMEEPFCGENEENLEIEDQKCLLNEEIEIKTDDHDFNRFEDSTISPQSEVTIRSMRDLDKDQSNLYPKHALTKKPVPMYKCDSCSYQTKRKCNLKGHVLKHRDPSEAAMYKCDTCLHRTNSKHALKKHMLRHKDPSEVTMHKCDYCSYQTKYKSRLERHLPRHMDPSEVTMYKCDLCSFQAKHKYSVRNHMLKHKDPSEVTMYKCDSCSFQTKRKSSLNEHMLKHKDASEVTMHKCDYCSFQTKRKSSLNEHVLKHKDASEVTMHKCDYCSFQTKHKWSLRSHMLKHKDPSEVKMYKCDYCSYQTNRKSRVGRHLLSHKDPSEVAMYKCDLCSFQTKHKYSLRYHMLKHKDPSEVTMYKCDYCSHQTKRKRRLKLHLLRHKDPSEVAMYKCDLCSFQTKHKFNLRDHTLRHKDPSEVPMYKCDCCSLQTKRKRALKGHLLKHKNPSKVTVYKCDLCSFQTKSKSFLKSHSMRHKDASEVKTSSGDD